MSSLPRQFLSRRRVLGLLVGIGSSSLAGCFSPHMGGSVPELSFYNGTDQSVTVVVTVSQSPSDDHVIDETFTLAPEETREYTQPFTEEGRKHLTVVIDGTRRGTYEWEADADADSTGMSVVISREELSINQVRG